MTSKIVEIYPKIKLTIKPWICPSCSFVNNNHLYYCEICSHQLDYYSINNSNINYYSIDKKRRVYRAFGSTKGIILPVLSCYSESQFKKNIIKLYDYFVTKKINGIWILPTDSDIKTVTNVFLWTKKIYPDFWIGINLIGMHIPKVLNYLSDIKPDGIWIDNSHLTDQEKQNIPEIILDQFKKLKFKGLYFGGVLFKYTSVNGDPLKIIKKTNKYMDVLTTSGEKTGVEIEQDKIKFIHKNTHKNILIANASGITPENVHKIKKLCSIFIVRTSIVDKKNNIDLKKLNKLIKSIKF